MYRSQHAQQLQVQHLQQQLQQQQQQHQQQLQQQQQQLRGKAQVREVGVNTDKLPEPSPQSRRPPSPPLQTTPRVRTRDRSVNTDPPPRSPPPPRKVSHGTNTSNVRSVSKGVETALRMEVMLTKEESEARVREAVARAEEEIYGCPLLQKAMARVEAEALGLATSPEEKAVPEEKVVGRDFGCQGGDSTGC